MKRFNESLINWHSTNSTAPMNFCTVRNTLKNDHQLDRSILLSRYSKYSKLTSRSSISFDRSLFFNLLVYVFESLVMFQFCYAVKLFRRLSSSILLIKCVIEKLFERRHARNFRLIRTTMKRFAQCSSGKNAFSNIEKV